jgi:hypothetical protein
MPLTVTESEVTRKCHSQFKFRVPAAPPARWLVGSWVQLFEVEVDGASQWGGQAALRRSWPWASSSASRPTRRQGGPVSQAVGAPVPGFTAHMGAAAAAADQATWPPCMQLAAGAEAGRLHQRLGFPMMKVDSGPPRAGPQVASSRLGRGFLIDRRASRGLTVPVTAPGGCPRLGLSAASPFEDHGASGGPSQAGSGPPWAAPGPARPPSRLLAASAWSCGHMPGARSGDSGHQVAPRRCSDCSSVCPMPVDLVVCVQVTRTVTSESYLTSLSFTHDTLLRLLLVNSN